MKKERKLVANNKKARHEYFIEDTYEAGIVLTGTEIKSVRQGKVNIKESYAKIINGEVFIIGMHISPYEQGNIFNVDPLRERKLLLNKRVKMYINESGLAKMEIGVAQGKKLYDKRADIAQKDAKRRMDRAIRREY